MGLLEYKEQTCQVLTEREDSRDSDEILYYFVLIRCGVNPSSITAHQLLRGIHDGIYPSIDTISRYRRKWQEEMPQLRGKTWQSRQLMQDKVKSDMGYISTNVGEPGTTP